MTKSKQKKARTRGPGGVNDASPSHLLHRALQAALDVYAEEGGSEALTQRQFAVLAEVAAREGCNQTDLVRATGIDRSTLADLIARMIRKGYVQRARSGADARANLVALTDAGRAALEAAEPVMARSDARILKRIPKRIRPAFLEALERLVFTVEVGEPVGPVAEPDAAQEPSQPKLKSKPKKKGKARSGGGAETEAEPAS